MILIIGPGGCGFTFLAWTISFLRGDTTYTKLTGETIPLVDNPLRGVTAHLFFKDRLVSTAEINALDSSTSQSIVYFIPTHQNNIDDILQVPGKKIIFQNQTEYARELFSRMCLAIPDSDYANIIKQLDYDKDSIKQVMLECNRFFTDYYQIPAEHQNFMTITYPDIFQNLDQKIYDIFEYLDLKISSNRLTAWTKVYQQYRDNNQDFQTKFLPRAVEVDNVLRLKILKEIIQWTHGSSLQK